MIEEVGRINGDEFRREFVRHGCAVLIKGLLEDWPALRTWSLDYFQSIGSGVEAVTKVGSVADGALHSMTLSDYATMLRDYEIALGKDSVGEQPPYLHDVPIFHLLPCLEADIGTFPLDLLPRWYGARWPRFVQFFLGPTGALTPLHFDTLFTHNLFFQVAGTKRFTLIPAHQRRLCYLTRWRWSEADAEEPDFARHPLLGQVDRQVVSVTAGDVLYLPPGTLHQVRSETLSVSFNIDWHTRRSALRGIATVFEGAPLSNLYYNWLLFLGVGLGVPHGLIFRFYRPYLNFVS